MKMLSPFSIFSFKRSTHCQFTYWTPAYYLMVHSVSQKCHWPSKASCIRHCISSCQIDWLLAHLSRRLTRWAYSIPIVRRPHFQTWISLKLDGQSWSNFICSFTEVGERLHTVLGRLDQNSGFHGNRKPPLTYNGENDVSTFSWLFFIQSFLYLQVTRTCIKSRTSSNFGQIGLLTTELAALEHLKNLP